MAAAADSVALVLSEKRPPSICGTFIFKTRQQSGRP
jgi:hypothetical protein